MIVQTLLTLLSNPVSFTIIIGGLIVSGLWWFKAYVKPVTKVDLLRLRDRRGKSLSVSVETDLGLICRKVGGVVNRYIKAGPSFTFHERGRMTTRFFAVEGKAYTAIPKPPEQIVKTNDDNKEVPLVNVNVKDYLKFTWTDKEQNMDGETFYNQIPEPYRKAIESDVVGITVEMAPIDEKTWKLQKLSSEEINDEDERRVLRNLVDTQEPSTRKTIMNQIYGIILGALIMYMLITRGII